MTASAFTSTVAIWREYPLVFLLEALLIGECDGEPLEGQQAVAWVVRTRVGLTPRYGRGWREVILRAHAFSCFWTDFSIREEAMRRVTPRPRALVTGIMHMPPLFANPAPGATHYANLAACAPSWAPHMQLVRRIGAHTFFRER